MRGPNGGGLVVFAEESDTNVWRHVKLQMVGSAKIGRLSAKSRYVRWFELNPKRKDGKRQEDGRQNFDPHGNNLDEPMTG